MTTKTFDAVKLMRELRDQLGREIEGLSPEDRIRFIRQRAESTRLGKPLNARTQRPKRG